MSSSSTAPQRLTTSGREASTLPAPGVDRGTPLDEDGSANGRLVGTTPGRPDPADGGARVPAPAQDEAEDPDGAAAQDPDEVDGLRQVRLTVARVNPWSALKLSFLVAVALGVAMVVAVFLLWSVLEGMGVFRDVNTVVAEIVGSESSFDLEQLVGLSRVLSLTVVVAVANVVLLTLMATLAAVLYNICAALVGGLRVTLTDD